MVTTSDDLKAWRARTGFSQGKLAQALGVHRESVSRWENGTREVPPCLGYALVGIEATAKAMKAKRTKTERG